MPILRSDKIMNHYKNEFINGKIFSKEDILKILEENRLSCKIISINYSFFKKIYIKIEEGKKIYLLKLSLDNYSIALAKNEENGYLNLNKFYKSKFNLVNYKMINRSNNYALSKIEFINGIKGNYFEFNKFYNYNFSSELKTIQLKDYITLIKDRYYINQNNSRINELFSHTINIFLSKYETYKIPLDASHGDFIHYNTLKTSNKNYVFDLEFFQKERSYLYDSFHWYITPIFFKSIKFNTVFTLVNNIYSILIKILNMKLKRYHNKLILENKKLFETLLILFLLERYLTLNYSINLENIDELIDNERKIFLEKHCNLILDLLIKLTKKYN